MKTGISKGAIEWRILTHRKRFENLVAKYRRILGIPAHGFIKSASAPKWFANCEARGTEFLGFQGLMLQGFLDEVAMLPNYHKGFRWSLVKKLIHGKINLEELNPTDCEIEEISRRGVLIRIGPAARRTDIEWFTEHNMPYVLLAQAMLRAEHGIKLDSKIRPELKSDRDYFIHLLNTNFSTEKLQRIAYPESSYRGKKRNERYALIARIINQSEELKERFGKVEEENVRRITSIQKRLRA